MGASRALGEATIADTTLAIFRLYLALARGDLVVVAPTVATSPVFTLLLGVYPFRQERIDARKRLGVGLVVPGVALIALRSP